MVRTRYPFPSFPSGWFAVGFSADVGAGAVVRRQYFDRELVLFRGASGAVAAVDAYCPHMGAHLGHGGVVDGDALRCPFHGFCFDGDGRCVSTPYGSAIPPTARLGSYTVEEKNGLLLMYFHPEGHAPNSAVPELDEDGWAPMRTDQFSLATHPQETTENSVDLRHFGHVHGYIAPAIVKPMTTDGPELRLGYTAARSMDFMGMPGQTIDVEFEIYAHGLGYSLVHSGIPSMGISTRNFVLATPTTRDSCELRVAMSIRNMADEKATDQMLTIAFKGFLNDVSQDFAIWEHKVYVETPALAGGDGPVGAYRRWARQFYTAPTATN